MRISLFQQNIVVGGIDANLRKIDDVLSTHGKGGGLFVLPELCTTGWGCFDDSAVGTIDYLRNLAVRHGVALAGSVLAKRNDGLLLNNAFVAFPTGAILTEPKRHLFSYGGEDVRFDRGTQRLIFEIDGSRVCLMVCYDLRFPAWSRNRIVDGEAQYDILIYAAEFPSSRIGHWDKLLVARAIENQCFVAAVNCADCNRYCGHSVILDYNGNAIVSAGDNPDHVISADLDCDNLREHRRRYPFLADADDYKCL